MNPRVRLSTVLGDIILDIQADEAPNTAAAFLKAVDEGRYSGARFVRAVRSAEDPHEVPVDLVQAVACDGEALVEPVEHEPTSTTGLSHLDGAVSLPRAAPGTGNAASFFVAIGNQPECDFGGRRQPDGQGFAVFGRVSEGLDLVRKIHTMQTDKPSSESSFDGQLLTTPVSILGAYREDLQLDSLAAGSPLSPPQEPRAPRAAWFTLGVIVATLLFGFVDRQVLSLVAAPMSESLSLTDSQLGMVQGLAFSLFSVLFVYPIGMLADRFDRRLVLTGCIAVWAAGTAACGLAGNFEELFLAAMAIAAGEAGLPALAYSAVPELFPGRQRITANFIFFFASILGVSLGLVLGGAAIGSVDLLRPSLPSSLQGFESWRLAFFAVAAPAPLFIGLVLITSLRKTARPTSTDHGAHSTEMIPYLRHAGKPLILVVLGSTTFHFAFGGLIIWTPVAMARLFGTTPAQNGTGLGSAVAVGSLLGVAAGAMLLPRLMKRMGPSASVRLAWLALLFGGPIVIGMLFVTAAWQAYVIVGQQMALAVMVGSLVPTMLQDLAPAGLRARTISIYTILGGLLGGASVLIIGAFSDSTSDPRGLLMAAVATAVPAWLFAAVLMRAAEKPFAAVSGQSTA
jgi:cyclophilin family peptidyl-prolyl cis-trans isomerase/predicted MFS family arabinose efflux permease